MTWIQTGSNRAFDLRFPDPAMVDFDIDIAEALARLARFNGHVRSGPYSVAQHCVLGADAVFRDTGEREAAAAFLLHDAHEAYLGDIPTPVARALALAVGDAGAFADIGPSVFKTALRSLKAHLDRVIYTAAGIGSAQVAFADLIRDYDLRMLATERRLLGPAPKPWQPEIEAARPIRMVGRLRVWPWPEAADEYRARLRAYLPERSGASPARPKPRPRQPGARQALQEA